MIDNENVSSNRKRPKTPHLFSILFTVVLLLPALLSIIAVASPAGKSKPFAKAPAIELGALLEPEYYQAWEHYVNQSFEISRFLVKVKRWLDYRVFNTTDVAELYVGRDGWIYPRTAVEQSRRGACDDVERLRGLVFDLSVFAHLAKLSGRRLIVTVAPDKTKIYPEFTGSLPADSDCRKTAYELFVDACTSARVDWFVRLDERLIDAKASGDLLYDKTGAFWNQRGATIAAKALLAEVFEDSGAAPGKQRDLAAQLFETTTDRPRSSAAGHHRFSSAVLYGGAAMAEMMPMLSRPFNRTDAIYADTLPSSNHMENLSTYDVAMVILDASQLEGLQIDLDRICRMLQIESLAGQENSIPLKTISARSHLSLKMENRQLQIKSIGEKASLVLPSLPGSESNALRILALDLDAPNDDTLAWRIVNPSTGNGEKLITKGKNRLYFILPVQPSVRLEIFPGRHPGLYRILSAALHEYGNGLSLAGMTGTYRGKVPLQPTTGDAGPDQTTARGNAPQIFQAPEHPEVSSIQLHDFEAMRVFQRTGSTADIVVSGTFQGRPRAIEARVTHHANDEGVTPWAIIDSAPADGVFMGILREVPQGGWYRLAVRFAVQHEVVDAGHAKWGIGMLVGCIGQSNMKEWFHSGEEVNPHPLLSVHRNGRWMAMERTGNGAIAFGNRLIGRLGIPVGLLDDAVNGSGLRKEADWGAGYWMDRSQNAIYDRFIRAVTKAGGALEYVVWMQGEADAARATISENQYRSALKDFIENQVRQNVDNGSNRRRLPFLIVGMVKRPVGRDAPHQAIRMAQHKVAEDVQACYLAATSLDLKNKGRQHLDPAAYTTLGLRVAQTVLYLLGEEAYYRGPSVFGATVVDDETIDVRLSHHEGFDFTPARMISGWEIVSRGERVPIADVARKNGHTVRITTAEALKGPLIIRYLYGAMPDTSRSIHDNSPMELPLEPVELRIE